MGASNEEEFCEDGGELAEVEVECLITVNEALGIVLRCAQG